ncbi:hypothetical protein BCR44DRAFT_1193763 [Catenaria anguillulae PL171]|uniref:PAS domain-containing protein n=1 Tax=Catenaria anguillulae PL171 TaxID=765915 RepID=A0A1Y2HI87_9FUNG|nr:hypothetical protein BCR44DRAFT_1193763 [Catenaria anguillulae PL171]
MSRQQQHQPSRYGHSHSHSHSHSHPFGPAHTHPHHHHDADPDNQGGTGGYADIDDEMAMLGYHHSGGPSPLDDYHYPDRPVAPDTSLAPGQYQQRLIYLQQHQHQHQHQQRAAAAAAQAHAAASTFGPPSEHAEPNGWHGRAHLHLHHHHPPGYGRHLHAHAAAAAARYAPYPPQAGAPAAAAAAAARRSVTGSPVLAKDQHQLQMNVLKSPTADMMAAIGADTRSHRSGSQRSGHLTHRSPSTSSLPAASAAAPAPARTHPSHVHKHHALPPRPRVHHPSDAYDGLAAKSAPAPTSTTPNQSPVIPRPLDPISLSSPSDSNGYRPSGSNGNSSSSDNSSSRLARTARATRAAESRSTAAHEGSATSTDDSSSSDPTRVPASTTSSSGSSSTNTKTQSATSSAPESVPEPPPVPPVPPPQQQQQQQQPQPQVVVPEKRTRAAKQGAAEQAQSANKQTVPPPASLQLTKDRAWAQSVIEHVSDMVLSLAPNGTIVWASPSARKVVGMCIFLSRDYHPRHCPRWF